MLSRISAVVLAMLLSTPVFSEITIDATSATHWKIANGALSLDWNPASGSVFGIYLTGYPDNLVDPSRRGKNGQPLGLYMDNTGANYGSGEPSSGYRLAPDGSYLDWWFTTKSNAKNAFTRSMHFIVQPNDPTLYVYFVAQHAATDIPGDLVQVQYVFRIDPAQFNTYYSVEAGLNNRAAKTVPIPADTILSDKDPGRQVENATLDLQGLPGIPPNFGRKFYTKYDYSFYEYLHRAHGIYGPRFAAWTVLPSTESLSGGPTKQDLVYTESILTMEAQSNHLNYNVKYTPPPGVASTRIFGPFGFHFNALDAAHHTAAALHRDAVETIPSARTLASRDSVLTGLGYAPAAERGKVEASIAGGGSPNADTAWVVLADPFKNHQLASDGHQYWTANNVDGHADLPNVAPGQYRLSVYKLGEWGELRHDGVTVTPQRTTELRGLSFKPENFSTAPPLWTIGKPDRSAHEFLHGSDSSGADDREYYGTWNFWKDFEPTGGTVIYYATAVGNHSATNDLGKWNYTQWSTFNPGLYAGIYNPADDTVDGYRYVVPAYVKALPAGSGPNGVATPTPPWQVHFTATAKQQARGRYAILSVGLAATTGSLTASLNGHALSWRVLNSSDAPVRSGLSGYYQWIAFEWPTAYLAAAGADNVLTLKVTKGAVMYDALRMEIANTSAIPSSTGWHDYEYVDESVYVPANDALPNND